MSSFARSAYNSAMAALVLLAAFAWVTLAVSWLTFLPSIGLLWLAGII